MSVLIFEFELEAPGGGRFVRLRVRRNPDQSVSYVLRPAVAGCDLALTNLQLKKPLPSWQEPGAAGLTVFLERILDSLATGVYRYRKHETAPGAHEKPPESSQEVADGEIWIVDLPSRSYDWFVAAGSEQEALRVFKAMWRDWCRQTGADPYYWGEPGDKWADVSAVPVKLGQGYMDREPYRLAKKKN